MAERFFSDLLDNCQRVLCNTPSHLESPVVPLLGSRCRLSFSSASTSLSSLAPQTTMEPGGKISYNEVLRPAGHAPLIHAIRTKPHPGHCWTTETALTSVYNSVLDADPARPFDFKNKTVLLTGAGPGSIGSDVLRGLLRGGARVIVTTRQTAPDTMRFYQNMYMHNGTPGCELVVVPFNQASRQDIESLVLHIYDAEKGLGWDLDHVIPFAALSEAGREIDNIDSRSELAHRVMLTNVLRLLGAIKTQKRAHDLDTSSTQVILPLSPNHGDFGNDGLYPESKLALETLFQRWHSETWSDYLSICGASIGWTRGTALMAANNVVAAGMENLGIRTFSQHEMARCILALMTKPMVEHNDLEPISADLTGGLAAVPNLSRALDTVREKLAITRDLRRALAAEEMLDNPRPPREEQTTGRRRLKPLANMQVDFPKLPTSYDADIRPLGSNLCGMLDLDRVVVVTGFSEMGPYGNSRTRWDVEARGTFSLEGCIEMAWIMGLIKHYDGDINGELYSGWVDAETNAPVHDSDVKERYEGRISDHTGIRLMDNDPATSSSRLLQEVILEEDLPPFMASRELAEQYRNEHGNHVNIRSVKGEADMAVHFKKGAILMLPKALRADRRVAGQIPKGWDPRTYGISEDIITQVDHVTLYALVTTVEALLASGITDPYEIYNHIHISEIGNCIGSGFGGAESLKGIFKGRYLDRPVQNDVLAESFINTIPAWINMLILSSAGPIRTAVGACATSIESLETGYETIVGGKAKLCLVGGVDDLDESVASEFANMKATVDPEKEFEKGRTPNDMSRPMTSTRNGFVESQGSGVQVIASARLALDMGLPIYGIIAWASTSSDKTGRSVPAPGKGILTNAREARAKFPHPLLDPAYRRRRLEARQSQIIEYTAIETEVLQAQLDHTLTTEGPSGLAEDIGNRLECIKKDAERDLKDAVYHMGNAFWHNIDQISPIRGALAVWGLTIDDLDFATLHGTSTIMNDLNESQVLQQQLMHLGRQPGNVILTICQKYLTGHSKGAAGAWMLNGALQALNSGMVPGNRNADNIDTELQACDLLVYPCENVHTSGLKAFSLTSFGFGQKGAQAIGIHPRYLYATLEKREYEEYMQKVAARQRRSTQFFQKAMATNTMFVAKEKAPYEDADERAFLLDPKARFGPGTL